MLAARITLPHFSVSSARNLAKFPDDIGIATPPNSTSLALTLLSQRAALISLLSLAMISFGVLAGAPAPCQPLASYPGINSATAGTSGSASERVEVVTATARSLPDLMCSIEDGTLPKNTC